MVINLPLNTFIFYIAIPVAQIVFVLLYGIKWISDGKKNISE